MRRLSRVVTTVASVAALGLAAGCGEDNPTPSASNPTPLRTPDEAPVQPAPPKKPAQISSQTRGGAEASAKYFITSLNYSGATGNLAPLRNSYASSCTRCEAIADSIEATYAKGGRYEGGSWLPRDLTFYRLEGRVAVLDVVVDYSAQQWFKTAGADPEMFDASSNNLHSFQLSYGPSDGWRVGALDPDK